MVNAYGVILRIFTDSGLARRQKIYFLLIAGMGFAL
jgi:hypothetical protein